MREALRKVEVAEAAKLSAEEASAIAEAARNEAARKLFEAEEARRLDEIED